jgi:hypothetical protein
MIAEHGTVPGFQLWGGLTLWRASGPRGAREARDIEFLHQIGPGWGVLFLHHILTPSQVSANIQYYQQDR